MSGSSSSNGGPCGACKYLRRKCASECIFAPYFDSEEGTSRFAAVHKIFGASNTSKLLLMIPASRRFEAVFTLSYEALARLRDPVYGCVAHIFALQHQVMNLEAELAYVQTQLSTLQSLLPPNPPINSPSEATSSSLFNAPLIETKSNVSSSSSHIPCMTQQQQQQQQQQPKEDIEVSRESMDLSTLLGPAEEDGDLNDLTREFVSKYLTRGGQ